MLFCFEFFLTKTGQILNNLRVYASDAKPIRITQNNKYGYIVEVTAGTADKGTTIKLTIWCDKVGSTGATPTGTRTYEI